VSSAPDVTVEAVGISKWFGDLVALSDVSFSIGPGVSALLGPNGAGKSTLLRVLCGLTAPSQGKVTILGKTPRRDLELFGRIGLVPQQEAVFDELNGMNFVSLGASLHGLGDPGAAAVAAIELVELDAGDQRPIASYSKGMRQRIKVAFALAHQPDVVVLDEPLEGLDPRQRVRMIELFRQLGDEGRTVIVSSHVLDEVERFGSRVLVVAQGRLVAEGDFHAIRELMDERPHRLRLRTDRPRPLAGALLTDGAVLAARVGDDDSVLVDTVDVAAFRRRVAVVAQSQDARLLEVVPLDDDLDSDFRYLVGRRS
jgi:ABC-2 type transport system ATP-binding protein